MKPPYLIGLVIALLIMAAIICAPLLRSSDQKAAEDALQNAAVARQQLARQSLQLARLAESADIAALRTPDAAETAVADEAFRTQLDAIEQQFGNRLRRAQREASEDGLEPTSIDSISASPADVQRAIQGFASGIELNRKLLNDAISSARAAVQASGDTIGVAQVLGIAQYTLAVDELAEAASLRTKQHRQQASLLVTVAEIARIQGAVRQYDDIDLQPAIDALQNRVDAIQTERKELQNELDQERVHVDDLAARLEDARAQLNAAEEQYNEVRDRGFNANEPGAFEAYRNAFRQAVQKLRDAELRVHTLRDGTIAGATFADNDVVAGRLRGGELEPGLTEAQHRVDTLEEIIERLDTSEQSLTERIAALRTLESDTAGDASTFQDRLSTLNARRAELWTALQSTHTAAIEQEEQALRSIKSATTAFSKAQRAAETLVREAREVQRERDPERKNARLQAILQSPYLTQFGSSAQATAHMLEARILAQRSTATAAFLGDIETLQQLLPATELDIDLAKLRETAETARTAGLDALDRAQKLYGDLANGPANTAWVPQAGLATSYALATHLDPTQAAAHSDAALTNMQQVVENRQQFPYVRPLLPFYQHLQRLAGAAPTLPPDTPPSETSEEEPGGDDFFFGDGG